MMHFTLQVKPFSFRLTKKLIASNGEISLKVGWLIKLQDNLGRLGWGEISPLNYSEREICEKILKGLGETPSREVLEKGIKEWPGALSFGIGAALAELEGQFASGDEQEWLTAPNSAYLLPTNNLVLDSLDYFLEKFKKHTGILTFKWKVATQSTSKEHTILHQILNRLPSNARIRIDANGGWNRHQAEEWASKLKEERKLEWLEQPLSGEDIEGLVSLSKQVPVALDESLRINQSLKAEWKGWQIRRPSLDGDPRILLDELRSGVTHRAISTAFETGIGLRWVHYLATLQQKTTTPTAPGLAPGWSPSGNLFNKNPKIVWEAV